MSDQQQQTFGGLAITQWVMVSVALILYCLLVQFDFFNSDFLQSAFLIQELGRAGQAGKGDLIAAQPVGVAVLLRSITLHPPSDIVFRAVAFVQAAATLVFATLLFVRSLRFPVALAGGVLLVHYTWAGAFALLPFSWAGPIFALFAYALVNPKQSWLLALSLVLSAVVCTPLLALQIPILLLWLTGEGIAQSNQPELVRSTLNTERLLVWRDWVLIGIASVCAVTIAYFTFTPVTYSWSQVPYHTAWMEGGTLGYADHFEGWRTIAEVWVHPPILIILLLIGSTLLGLLQRTFHRPLALFNLALFVVGVIYTATYHFLPDTWTGYAAFSIPPVLIVGVGVTTLIGFADAYFNKWYVTALAVLLILAWIPVYDPTYLT